MSEVMSEVGEKAFLANMLPQLRLAPSFLNGFGHDASVIDLGFQDQLLVMKIDRAPSPVATAHGWENYSLWGRLAVTSNCSDILAAGGIPKAVMLCVCVPGMWPIRDATDIILGCEEECLRWGVAFVGGDTKESSMPEVVGSAVGLTNRNGYLSRNAGRPGQLIVLAGLTGGYIGSYFQLLYREPGSISSKQQEDWIHYVAYPTAKWTEAEIVRRHGGATAGMDTSDGLYDALISMSGKGMGAEIDLDTMPYHPSIIECSQVLGVPLFNIGLGIGDWNIVYAVEEEAFEKLRSEALSKGAHLTAIGRFTEKPGITARDSHGNCYRVDGIVNEHFKIRMEDQKDFMEQARFRVPLIPL